MRQDRVLYVSNYNVSESDRANTSYNRPQKSPRCGLGCLRLASCRSSSPGIKFIFTGLPHNLHIPVVGQLGRVVRRTRSAHAASSPRESGYDPLTRIWSLLSGTHILLCSLCRLTFTAPTASDIFIACHIYILLSGSPIHDSCLLQKSIRPANSLTLFPLFKKESPSPVLHLIALLNHHPHNVRPPS